MSVGDAVGVDPGDAVPGPDVVADPVAVGAAELLLTDADGEPLGEGVGPEGVTVGDGEGRGASSRWAGVGVGASYDGGRGSGRTSR